MTYYKLRINEENKVWKKYFSFDASFFLRGKEIDFTDIYPSKEKMEKLKIQALNDNGLVVLNENEFIKTTAPNFDRIDKITLIKGAVFKKELFEDIKGLEFVPIKITGKFKSDYKLMNFTNVINCVDYVNSVKEEFEFLSTLILLKSKIPNDVDGFFLSGWANYDRFEVIVNDTLKKQLLKLEKASEFLIFDKIEVS
ncbi:hypothetical protein [Flavobacterium sp. 140616W15]|uniref:hypothetical protein n=1 Tax=Flavobacterium sp. 140616W15 TaxID=2478552 RepID=UPI000F0C3DBD|nr:hypothetical protein [Flavobacterium sp. 140616W15]AYN04401.1 hypothetical protein EAG11_09570 [Flavobacterium sp. 140616W15]